MKPVNKMNIINFTKIKKVKLVLVGVAIAIIIFLGITHKQAGAFVLELLPRESNYITSNLHNTNPLTSKNTPTPDLSGIPILPQGPSSTPLILSSTIDLSPTIDRLSNFDIFVEHSDGTLTLYLIGVKSLAPDWEEQMSLPEEVLKNLPLEEGDRISSWLPPSPWRRVNPPAIPTKPYISPTPTSILIQVDQPVYP